MSVRLAFAVAAHLEPDILLVDEVLAVGDAAFQRKSLGKMNEVASQGRTVIFVSHNLAIIQTLCQRAVLLERGTVVADAPVYADDRHVPADRFERAADDDLLERTDRDGRGWRDVADRTGLEIRDADAMDRRTSSWRPPAPSIVVHVTEVLPMMECRLTIVNGLGHAVTTLDSEFAAPSDVREASSGHGSSVRSRRCHCCPAATASTSCSRPCGRSRTGCRPRRSSTSNPACSAIGRCSPTGCRRRRRAGAQLAPAGVMSTRARRPGSDGFLAPRPRAAVEPLLASPRFSIVVPVYQAAGTIADALGSVLSQTEPAHEIIVVDDGSTDDLASALRPFAGRITLITKENGGSASAYAAALAAATGEFMAILDADDAYHPQRLEALAELACQRPDLDLITTDARFVVGGEVVGTFAAHNPFATTDQRKAIFERCFVGGWPAVRLERLRAIGGFDERFRIAYDWDAWLRLILSGSAAGLVDAPYYDYRLHPGALTANRAASLWGRVRLLEKARLDPLLEASERQALARSLRTQRTRAVFAATRDALAGRSRQPLARYAIMRGVAPRARAGAVLALAAPALARRIVPSEPTPARALRPARGRERRVSPPEEHSAPDQRRHPELPAPAAPHGVGGGARPAGGGAELRGRRRRRRLR